MKVTAKGQVTIPVRIRKTLNIHPGTEVDFVVEGNTAIIVPNLHGQQIVERLHGRGSVRMTTDEIMVLTRGE
ncbi:MAG: AbrB/MazE/SpoVT family DNA-binding domain-containing protein [bacterium]